MKLFFNFFLFLLFLFFSVHQVRAVTTTITQAPPTITQDPFLITVSISGAKAGRNYLRADLYEQSSTEYAGETYNDQEWYSGDDATKYAPIDIVGSETHTATISASLSTIPTTWSASDNFFLRIRRYTASGSYTSTEADTSAIPIIIVFPTPTPTLSPTPAPTLTPSPTYQPSVTLISSTDNVYISEALTAPESGQPEWVELYNANNFTVSLESWFIDDIENAGSNLQVFSLSIGPQSYNTVQLPSALFNNNGDSIRLLNTQKVQKDYVSYSQTIPGKSISRNDVNTHQTCITFTTKNDSNASCLNTPTTNIIASAQEHASETDDESSILGINTSELDKHIPTTNAKPRAISVTTFQGVGHDPLHPQPTDYEEEPTTFPEFPNAIFSRPSLTGFLKAGATSAAGISLLNIAYILYRMNIWPVHQLRQKIFSSIGFPLLPG